MAGALMISGALLNLAPVASAAEPETAGHCIIDHPVVCLVVCTVENQSVKPCAQIECNVQDFPTLCFVVNEAWQIVP